MATKPEYKELAETIMFSGATLTMGGPPYGFAYRKGKTVTHLKDAVRKGMKEGRGKVEFEISFIALYLEKVLRVTA